MNLQDLGYYQGEVAKLLRACDVSDTIAVVLSERIMDQIVKPALRAQRVEYEQRINHYSLTKTETLGDVQTCDNILLLLD